MLECFANSLIVSVQGKVSCSSTFSICANFSPTRSSFCLQTAQPTLWWLEFRSFCCKMKVFSSDWCHYTHTAVVLKILSPALMVQCKQLNARRRAVNTQCCSWICPTTAYWNKCFCDYWRLCHMDLYAERMRRLQWADVQILKQIDSISYYLLYT